MSKQDQLSWKRGGKLVGLGDRGYVASADIKAQGDISAHGRCIGTHP